MLGHVPGAPPSVEFPGVVAGALTEGDAGSPWCPAERGHCHTTGWANTQMSQLSAQTAGTDTRWGRHLSNKQSDCWVEGNALMTKRMEWSGSLAVNWIYWRERERKGAQNNNLQNMRHNWDIILETLRVSAAGVGLFLHLLFANCLYFPNRKNF